MLPLYEQSLVSLGMRFFRKSSAGAGLATVLAMKLRAGVSAPYPIDKLISSRVFGGRLVESIEKHVRAEIVRMLHNGGTMPVPMAELQVCLWQ
jgi:hypothetical protein